MALPEWDILAPPDHYYKHIGLNVENNRNDTQDLTWQA